MHERFVRFVPCPGVSYREWISIKHWIDAKWPISRKKWYTPIGAKP